MSTERDRERADRRFGLRADEEERVDEEERLEERALELAEEEERARERVRLTRRRWW
jgi:hypothetical protein